MNLLAIVNQAEDELGIPRSDSVGGSTDAQARQMLGLLNALCEELVDAHDWSALQSEATVQTTAGQDRYSLPADFRRMVSDTQYDRSGPWRLYGPNSPRVDSALRESLSAASIFLRFRLYGSTSIRFFPVPSGQQVFFEYISCHWGRAAGIPKARLDADTDTTPFRDQVLVAGLKWKYMGAKGFASADQHYADFIQLRDRAIADDVGGREISFGRSLTGYCSGDFTIVVPGA